MAAKVEEKEKGSGIYRVIVHHKGHKLKPIYFGNDKKLAQKAADMINARISLGIFEASDTISNASPLFKEYSILWLNSYVKPIRKHGTISRYEGILTKYLLPAIGKKRLTEIKRGDIKEMLLNIYSQGLSKSSVCLARDVLSGILSHALDEELIETNPATGILKIMKFERSKRSNSSDPFDDDELSLFLDTCKKYFPDHYPFFLCAARTGMRLGELLALEWNNIDWNKKYIQVRKTYKTGRVSPTKTDSSIREVDISNELYEALKKLNRERKIEGLKNGNGKPVDVIFHRNGEHMEQNYIRRVYERILSKAGIRHRRIHDLRHSFASLLLSAGVSPNYVKDQLGHSSIKMTCDTYGKWIKNQKNKDLINLLDSPSDQTSKNAPYTPPHGANSL